MIIWTFDIFYHTIIFSLPQVILDNLAITIMHYFIVRSLQVMLLNSQGFFFLFHILGFEQCVPDQLQIHIQKPCLLPISKKNMKSKSCLIVFCRKIFFVYIVRSENIQKIHFTLFCASNSTQYRWKLKPSQYIG